MPEPSPGLISDTVADGLTVDLWLGGRLALVQPKAGHRVGTDAALLAAAAGAPEGRIADIGAGVGAVGLALAQRSGRAFADLIEIDPDLARLADINAGRNGLQARVRVLRLDVLKPDARRGAGLADEAADCVITNPPFFDPVTVRASPNLARARAHVLSPAKGGAALEAWIRASLALLAPGGRFVMIHRPDALAMILAAIERRLGGLALLPVHPSASASAHRLLVSGVKGSKAPLRIAPPLILHGADGRLTAEADAIHRGEALVDGAAEGTVFQAHGTKSNQAATKAQESVRRRLDQGE
jgi:tRNA1(Val) A37 N6-methylase TrmN6